jgi:predicted DNA-binding protein (MmcQ/YjbR family)
LNAQDVIDYCLQKPGAYLNTPFGAEPLCARVGKRIFAEIYFMRPWVTLKCEPVFGMAMRQAYPENVRRGYHCPPVQQPYANTVTLDGTVPDDVLLEMIDHSYGRALSTLTKTERAEALAPKP